MKWELGPVVVGADDDVEDKIRGHEAVAAALDAADSYTRPRVIEQLDAVVSAVLDLHGNLAGGAVQVTASGHVADDDDAEWSTTVTIASIADAPA